MSGPARDGDLASELFKAGLEQGVLVLVENWDIEIDPQLDLTVLATVESLIDAVLSGWFDGGHASPPCNTFSASLFRPDGPRPVRDRDHLWGFDHDKLVFGDVLRLEVGNWLARLGITVCTGLALGASTASLSILRIGRSIRTRASGQLRK